MADFDFMASVVGAGAGLLVPGAILLTISQSGAALARLLPKKRILRPEDVTPELEQLEKKDLRLPLTASHGSDQEPLANKTVELDSETKKLVSRLAKALANAEKAAKQAGDEEQQRSIQTLIDRMLDNADALKESVNGEGYRRSNLELFTGNLELIASSLERITAPAKKKGETRLRVLKAYLENRENTNSKSLA